MRPDIAARLVSASLGYAFAFQTIGYFCWDHPDDYTEALSLAIVYLEAFSYRKMWSELSKKDREVVLAVFRSQDSTINRVRDLLQCTNAQFSPYKARLLNSGVITAPSNGIVSIALPWFGEFAARMMENT